jgi:hypothetical protein
VCAAGKSDIDRNPATKCVHCPAGSYSEEGTYGKDCEALKCDYGTIDDDSDAATPCVDCEKGTYIPRGKFGECSKYACSKQKDDEGRGAVDHDDDAATPCAVVVHQDCTTPTTSPTTTPSTTTLMHGQFLCVGGNRRLGLDGSEDDCSESFTALPATFVRKKVQLARTSMQRMAPLCLFSGLMPTVEHDLSWMLYVCLGQLPEPPPLAIMV